ncbi:MJ0042-type zinc finger domain-containing protein [Neisseria meningitidis]|uniref:MJ0042-type zinc finger domain-containing protein n=1 Tax=Neisseria meningitidis TaxID=487 RepID=UPI0002A4FEF1|nr:MJ0042-type zinc finger domain-containing protein [Neisseria meningitidis]ELL26907.1 MJ0042 family finger-like domain protein [Neisseria meningitidis 77221]
MPACFCPHCKTRLWVKETQLNVAQGFVVCQKCEGLFKAKDHLASTKEPIFNDLPEAVSDVKLVHRIGTHAIGKKQISRDEIDGILNGGTTLHDTPPATAAAPAATPAPVQTAAPARQEGFNWTIATLFALIVLIMQLSYLVIL